MEKLYNQRMLARIDRMCRNDNWFKYLSDKRLDDVLKNPKMVGNYSKARLPETGREVLEVSVSARMDGVNGRMAPEERAARFLVYKILRRNATHGVELDFRYRPDAGVTMRAIPVVLSRK